MRLGIVAAIGLTLLVPVFAALNNSYVQNVPPPPWIPTPPDITPPSDFKPPPDMTPPTNFHGKIPPNMCPPPVARGLLFENATFSGNGLPGASGYSQAFAFKVPNGTIGFKGYINWTWQAADIHATLKGPPGFKTWFNDTNTNAPVGLGSSSQSSSWPYDSYDQSNGQPAKPGDYTLQLSANQPVNGNVQIAFAALLACGGLGSG